MTRNEELIFGLKRWVYKTITYVGNLNDEEFFNNDLVFDACCYCIEVISEIGEFLAKEEEIKLHYKDVNFEALKDLKKNCFQGDNINLSLIYETITISFPNLLKLLK